MLPATKEIGDVRHAGKFGCRHNFSDYHPPGVISLRKGLFSSLSIRRFWGKRGKMEAKKGES